MELLKSLQRKCRSNTDIVDHVQRWLKKQHYNDDDFVNEYHRRQLIHMQPVIRDNHPYD